MITIVVLEKESKKEILINQIKNIKLNINFNLISFTNFEEMNVFCNDIKDQCIFFIDVDYDENKSGVDIAKIINKDYPQSNIIFVSEKLENVCEIYDAKHCYFIHFENIQNHVEKAIMKVIHLYNLKHTTIFINTGKSILKIETSSIIYIERIKRYSLIRFDETIVKTKSTLNQLLEQLPMHFYKCHNCYLVNFSQVKEKTKNEFVMNDENVVPIARKYIKEMDEAYQNYIII